MRIRNGIWGEKMLNEMRRHLSSPKSSMKRKARLTPTDIFEIELALTVLALVFPQAPANSFWALLLGYDFAIAEIEGLSDQQKRMIGIARHLLLQFKNKRQWSRALKLYREVNERVRLFDVDEQFERFTRRPTSVCPERGDRYQELLSQPLPYAKRKIVLAPPGTYLYSDRRRRVSFMIPDDLPPAPPLKRYTLQNRRIHQPLTVRWSTLLATARWMDRQHKKRGLPPRHWLQTLQRVEMRISSSEQDPFLTITPDGVLVLDKTQHFVGMVGAGKTTFMDIVAVWAALRGYHITLVVGDVMAVFQRVSLFRQLGLQAAPITGATNRKRHRKRLHRVLTTEHTVHPMQQEHEGFDYTGTVCLLNGLQKHLPPRLDTPPCLNLLPLPSFEEELDEEELAALEDEEQRKYACPLYSACSYDLAQHHLVESPIWVATPAGLVYTHVSPQIHPERMRFLEMVYYRSDLVIVDEADRVQVQFDALFSPSLTLIGREKESWLANLLSKVTQVLNQEQMEQVQYPDVPTWLRALKTAEKALLTLYTLLLAEPALLHWVTQERDYFNGLTLLEQLTIDICDIPKVPGKSAYDDPRFEAFWPPFEEFISDPLGEKEDHPLADLARQVLAVEDGIADQRLQAWLRRQPYSPTDRKALQEYALRLKFALMLQVLAESLNTLVLKWKQVEVILGLEGSSSLLFHSPPDDYAPLLPDAPMGNVLGFQYLRDQDKPKASGDLRVFRCMGVGRWLLQHFHDVLSADGVVGPHTLLLSGTSWAGTSPSYHLQLPVTGVLLPPKEELEEIAKSVFTLDIQRNPQDHPIFVSGKRGQKRIDALQEMLDELSREQHVGQITLQSKLEAKRDELPEGRQRILLVVGSYHEAKEAFLYLLEKRPAWGEQMAYLVSDDDEFESEWRGRDPRLRRGLVNQFMKTGAWLLIAPLLAVERGHNILNEEGKAALGAVYFLVRPHPRPDDISYIISSMNAWYMQKHTDASWLSANSKQAQPSFENVTQAFRGQAFKEWRRLLRTPLIYSTLKGNDLSALIWTQLVSLWQVIGRLVRGGCAAQVIFCDAKFAPQIAKLEVDETERTSLLIGMKVVLEPFFDGTSSQSPRTRDLVRILYEPLYQALKRMEKTYGQQL
jgi:hypothetical protein